MPRRKERNLVKVDEQGYIWEKQIRKERKNEPKMIA